MPPVTILWTKESPHHSSKVAMPRLADALTPMASVVVETERSICWPGGTSARKLGAAGVFLIVNR